MKKKIAVILAMVVVIMSLSACGGKFTCDLCGEEKSGKNYKSETLGEEVVVCQECYDEMKEAFGK